MPQLIFYVDGEFPQVHDLVDEKITVGRKRDNTIQILISFMSGHHAELIRQPDGAYRLIDLGSHNGTTVNGKRVDSAILEDRDLIGLGVIKCVFLSRDPVASAPVVKASVKEKEEHPGQEKAAAAVAALNAEVASLQSKREELSQMLAEQDKGIQAIRLERAGIDKEAAEARKTLEDLRKQLEQNRKENAEIRSDMAMREHLIRDLESARKKGEEELELQREKSDAFIAKRQEIAHENDRLRMEQKEIRSEVDAAHRELKEITASIRDEKAAESESASHVERVRRLKSEAAALAVAVAGKKDEFNSLEERFAREKQSLAGVQAELSTLQKEHAGREQQASEDLRKQTGDQLRKLEILTGQLRETESQCAQAASRLAAQQGQLRQLTQELEVIRHKNEELIREKAMIEDQLQMAQKEYRELCLKIDDGKQDLERFETDSKRELQKVAATRISLDTDVKSKSDELARLESAIEVKEKALDSIAFDKLRDVKRAAKELERENKEERKKLKQLQSELEKFQRKRQQIESDLAERETLLNDLNKRCADRKDEAERARKENETFVATRNELRAELERIRGEIDDTQSVVEAGRLKTAQLEQLKEIESKNSALESEAAKKRKTLEELAAELAGRQKELSELEASIANRKKEADDFAGLCERAEASRKELNEVEAKLKGRLADLSKSQETQKRLQDKGEEITRLIAEKTEALAKLDKELASKESSSTRLAETLEEKNSEIKRLDQRLQAAGVQLLDTTRDLLGTRKSSSGKGGAAGRKSAKRIEIYAGEHTPGASVTLKLDNGDETPSECPPLRIIQPRMRSAVQDFCAGAGSPQPGSAPPVGYFGLAACTRGSVHRGTDSLPSGDYPVLLMLHGSLEKDRDLLKSVSLEIPEKTLLVCWREGQLDVLAAELESGSAFQQFTDLLDGVSGVISVDARTAKLLDELHVARRHLHVPLPCPVDIPEWDLSAPPAKRSRGVFVSGDGFDPESPLHRARIDLLNALVASTGTKVTVYHHVPDLIDGLDVPGKLLTEPGKPLSFGEYLVLLGEHRLVMGFGKNLAGGEVMGDALITRTVFAGGDSGPGTPSIIFPDLCLPEKGGIEDLVVKVASLLRDDAAYAEEVNRSQLLARKHLSFSCARRRLGEFLNSVAARPTAAG